MSQPKAIKCAAPLGNNEMIGIQVRNVIVGVFVAWSLAVHTVSDDTRVKQVEERLNYLSSMDISASAPAPFKNTYETFGLEESIVTVFFHIHTKPTVLKCSTEELMLNNIIEPRYMWIGPKGLITEESQHLKLAEGGDLVFSNVHAVDSGNYTCTLRYILNNAELTSEVKYNVYVYHTPDKSIRLSVEFYTSGCDVDTVVSFENIILEHLANLIHNLQCEVHPWNRECHTVATTMAAQTHKLTFRFAVFPFALNLAENCANADCEETSDNQIKKAYTKIKIFFENNAMNFGEIPKMQYVTESLSAVKVDHCKPGFGKNVINSTQCPECCITCPPGKFSAGHNTLCTPCASGSYNENYGMMTCTNCAKREITGRRGATSKTECYRILPVWIIPLASSIGTSIILVISWITLRHCCRRTLAAQYMEHTESEVKKEIIKLANIVKDVDLMLMKSRLKPVLPRKGKKSPKYKVTFPGDQSVGLMSDTETQASTTTESIESIESTATSEPETSSEETASGKSTEGGNRYVLGSSEFKQQLADRYQQRSIDNSEPETSFAETRSGNSTEGGKSHISQTSIYKQQLSDTFQQRLI